MKYFFLNKILKLKLIFLQSKIKEGIVSIKFHLNMVFNCIKHLFFNDNFWFLIFIWEKSSSFEKVKFGINALASIFPFKL